MKNIIQPSIILIITLTTFTMLSPNLYSQHSITSGVPRFLNDIEKSSKKKSDKSNKLSPHVYSQHSITSGVPRFLNSTEKGNKKETDENQMFSPNVFSQNSMTSGVPRFLNDIEKSNNKKDDESQMQLPHVYSQTSITSGIPKFLNSTEKGNKKKSANSHWPNGAKLVVSFSMLSEAGGSPKGAESSFSGNPFLKGVPNLPAESWFRYGANEGVSRMLKLWKKHNIKVTSHVVGEAAVKYPKVAKAIADQGHEIATHGISWSDQWNLSYKDGLDFLNSGVDIVQNITGKKSVGYNFNWLSRSINTLIVLQEAGFVYHIDELSRDEPFVTKVRSTHQYLEQLKTEFDQLYLEGNTQRRVMSVSLHDRIGGTPSVVNVVDQFIKYAKKHKGVAFMKKIDIAEMVKNDPNTPVDNSKDEFNNFQLLHIKIN